MELKKLSLIISIFIGSAAIIGGIWTYEGRIVKAEDLAPIQQSIRNLNKRIDRSDLEAMARDIQRRMWLLEDQHGYAQAQNLYEYKCLKRDLNLTHKKIEELKK